MIGYIINSHVRLEIEIKFVTNFFILVIDKWFRVLTSKRVLLMVSASVADGLLLLAQFDLSRDYLVVAKSVVLID